MSLEPSDIIKREDEQFAHVFQPLDGAWAGEFTIYEDTAGQRNS